MSNDVSDFVPMVFIMCVMCIVITIIVSVTAFSSASRMCEQKSNVAASEVQK